MPTSYPSGFDNFTNPNGTASLGAQNHSGLHGDLNDAVEAMQAVMGTTAGTSLFKNFSAGQFPAKTNNETFGTPSIIGGTANNQVIGTPSITGGTASFASLTASSFSAGTITAPGTQPLSLVAGTGNLVKQTILQQSNGTNSYNNNVVILTGWGVITGTGAISLEESVTFGITFDSTPLYLSIDGIGYAASTAVIASLADFTNNMNNDAKISSYGCKNSSSSGFSFAMRAETGYTLGTANQYGYTWLAIGVKA